MAADREHNGRAERGCQVCVLFCFNSRSGAARNDPPWRPTAYLIAWESYLAWASPCRIGRPPPPGRPFYRSAAAITLPPDYVCENYSRRIWFKKLPMTQEKAHSSPTKACTTCRHLGFSMENMLEANFVVVALGLGGGVVCSSLRQRGTGSISFHTFLYATPFSS